MKNYLRWVAVLSLAAGPVISMAQTDQELERAVMVQMKLMGISMDYMMKDMASGKKTTGCYGVDGEVISLGEMYAHEGVDLKCISMNRKPAFFPVLLAMKCKSSPEYEGCSDPETKEILSQF
jgi:hypothetical protein